MSEEQKEDPFKELSKMTLDAVRKYGLIDKDGSIYIDSGVQKQKIGEVKDTTKQEEIPYTYIDDNGKTKVSITDCSNNLISKFNFKTIHGSKSEKIYLYEDGVYVPKGTEKIKVELEKMLGTHCTSRIVVEVLEKIKRKTAISREDFDDIDPDLICLENGILNLKTKELLPFDSKHYFKSKIPIRYKKDNENPKLLKFLEDSCYEEDVPVIQEWFGFCLYRRYFIKKAMILFGEKDTGKTVLLNTLIKFIGEKNCSGISLQRIASKDKFSLAFLKDKYLNVYDDLSSGDLKDSGGFKIATGGGYITGEYKFGDSFQFRTFAKNIFATNHIPNIKDINDDAYYGRWIPIPFDNRVDIEKQDNFLFEKLTTDEEMSRILNWALSGLDALFMRGTFSYNKTDLETKNIMQRQNNPLVAFADEVLYQLDGNKITKETMYQIYSKWCQRNSVPRLTKEQLGRNLAKYTNYMVAKGGKERIWENVGIKGEDNIF